MPQLDLTPTDAVQSSQCPGEGKIRLFCHDEFWDLSFFQSLFSSCATTKFCLGIFLLVSYNNAIVFGLFPYLEVVPQLDLTPTDAVQSSQCPGEGKIRLFCHDEFWDLSFFSKFI